MAMAAPSSLAAERYHETRFLALCTHAASILLATAMGAFAAMTEAPSRWLSITLPVLVSPLVAIAVRWLLRDTPRSVYYYSAIYMVPPIWAPLIAISRKHTANDPVADNHSRSAAQ